VGEAKKAASRLKERGTSSAPHSNHLQSPYKPTDRSSKNSQGIEGCATTRGEAECGRSVSAGSLKFMTAPAASTHGVALGDLRVRTSSDECIVVGDVGGKTADSLGRACLLVKVGEEGCGRLKVCGPAEPTSVTSCKLSEIFHVRCGGADSHHRGTWKRWTVSISGNSKTSGYTYM